MRDYFAALFFASLLGAICTSLAGSKLEKYMRYLAALLCILLIISPLRDLKLSTPSLPEEDLSVPQGNTLSELAQAEAETDICKALSTALSAGTGITPASLRIDIDWNTTEPVIHTVSVALFSGDFSRKEEVEAWVANNYGIPCTVTEHEESSCP